MTEGRSEASGPVGFDHGERSVYRLPAGGFAIEGKGEPPLQVVSEPRGWRIDGSGGEEAWNLQRRSDGSGGFVLRDASGRDEIGRTLPLVGIGRDVGLRYLLLGDGRLYRIVLRGPRDGAYELLGWETPGAYLRAIWREGAWTVVPTTACSGIPEIRALLILFAAEILDAEESFETKES